jgi:hypothetical protein
VVAAPKNRQEAAALVILELPTPLYHRSANFAKYGLSHTASCTPFAAFILSKTRTFATLAKAKSGSSLPTRYSRPSISSSSIRALKAHSKNIVVILCCDVWQRSCFV